MAMEVKGLDDAEKTRTNLSCVPENHVAAKDSGYHPFCSERCKLVDLSKWLGGEYVVSKPIFDIDDHS